MKKIPFVYKIAPDGVTLVTEFSPLFDDTPINSESNQMRRKIKPQERLLNRGIRSGEAYVFAGDLPVTGFGLAQESSTAEEPLLETGEVRLTLLSPIPKKLENAAFVRTEHAPACTRWRVTPFSDSPLQIELCACLLPYNGTALFVRAGGCDSPQELMLTIGEQKRCSRTLGACFFEPESQKLACRVEETNGAGDANFSILLPEPYNEPTRVSVWGNLTETAIEDGTVTIRFTLAPGKTFALQSLLFDEKGAASADELEKAASDKAEAVEKRLARVRVKTGDAILDAAFANAVLTLDYCHPGPGWLECGQFWLCYWTNNFQPCAALSLGDKEDVLTALDFFGARPGYNATARTGAQMEIRQDEEGKPIRPYDGMPYYLYQLARAIDAYGDEALEIFKKHYDNIVPTVRSMIRRCDPDGNGLYGFHRGCNAFMYQADHLAIPGDGISPSVMMIRALEILAAYAEKIGRTDDAKAWCELAAKGRARLNDLWDEDRFCAMHDLSGEACRAHFYTDFVFPVLYSDLPEEKKALSLLALRDALVYESESTGETLMRVGELLPSVFANDPPMPTQTGEAIRALFEAGMTETAWSLLRGCALAFSVYTESPGSAPERFSLDGRGEANYIFGNPTASFILAVKEGLFGLSETDGGRTLCFKPANLPKNTLETSLNGIRVKAEAGRRFTVEGAEGKDEVEFSLCVPAGKIALTLNGKKLDFSLKALLDGVRVTARAKAEKTMVFEIVCTPEAQSAPAPITVNIGETLDLPGALPNQPRAFKTSGKHHILLQGNGCFVDQPVEVLPPFERASAALSGKSLLITGFASASRETRVTFTVAGETFSRTLPKTDDGAFACRLFLKQELFLPAYDVRFVWENGEKCERGSLRAVNASVVEFAACPLDLTALLNADALTADVPWRYYDGVSLRLPPYALAAAQCAYETKENENGCLRFCRIEKGRTIEGTTVIEPSGFPSLVRLGIDRAVGAVSLLYAADTDVRLVRSRVGAIRLIYADGEKEIPLQAGENVGSLFRNFASDTVKIPVDSPTGRDSLNHYVIPCDETRILRFVEIAITKEDVHFALAGANWFAAAPGAKAQ